MERKTEIRQDLEKLEAEKKALAVEVKSADEKRLGEIEVRSGEITTTAESLTAELKDIEDREAEAAKIEAGKPAQKEERKMEEVYTVSSPEYRSAWSKKLLRQSLTEVEERAYATTDSANAVPTVVSDMFIEKLKKAAPTLNYITLLQIAGNVKFVAEGTNNAAAAHTQNAAVTPAADTVLNVSLGGTEFVKVIRISKSVQTMSVPAFENWLTDLLARDIAYAIENYIWNDSTNGITSATLQVANVTNASVTYAKLCELISKLPASFAADAVFAISNTTLWADVYAMVDSNGEPILHILNGEMNLFGKAIVVSDYIPAGTIYYGDLKAIVGNLSQGIMVDRSEESGFLANAVDFRGSAIFDSKIANTYGLVRFVKSA